MSDLYTIRRGGGTTLEWPPYYSARTCRSQVLEVLPSRVRTCVYSLHARFSGDGTRTSTRRNPLLIRAEFRSATLRGATMLAMPCNDSSSLTLLLTMSAVGIRFRVAMAVRPVGMLQQNPVVTCDHYTVTRGPEV